MRSKLHRLQKRSRFTFIPVQLYIFRLTGLSMCIQMYNENRTMKLNMLNIIKNKRQIFIYMLEYVRLISRNDLSIADCCNELIRRLVDIESCCVELFISLHYMLGKRYFWKWSLVITFLFFNKLH